MIAARVRLLLLCTYRGTTASGTVVVGSTCFPVHLSILGPVPDLHSFYSQRKGRKYSCIRCAFHPVYIHKWYNTRYGEPRLP